MMYLKCTYDMLGKDYRIKFDSCRQSLLPRGGWAIVKEENMGTDDLC